MPRRKGIFHIPHGAPLRLAAHLGRSITSSLLSPPAHRGLRRLGDGTDSGRAGGGEGGTAGFMPFLLKATRERRGGTRWVTFCLPRAWHLQRHGCRFSPTLLQDLTSQPQSPTKAHPPHLERGSSTRARPRRHLLGGSSSDAQKLLGARWWETR